MLANRSETKLIFPRHITQKHNFLTFIQETQACCLSEATPGPEEEEEDPDPTEDQEQRFEAIQKDARSPKQVSRSASHSQILYREEGIGRLFVALLFRPRLERNSCYIFTILAYVHVLIRVEGSGSRDRAVSVMIGHNVGDGGTTEEHVAGLLDRRGLHWGHGAVGVPGKPESQLGS